ncbi:NFX1-type zinc finger-containing protein 1 [Monoraphidium neglectum]|uniref:NFX1-type zinc finger-containing protein 1 n=1 Tax=Monoraphidium neglectum TaxID=145388 RepID=A0A0D2KU40_9CHLO|nr:NFX1-type zinc finger-containing protein 1 [Monoraphidium neglectum]KIY98958.1 NFX1-type zinc finger-containing protein 1 [Monoraphidium neglectum]|eukprot:XP_013897978.1 NFX1-type zinc finger-containing protein 1 [Monoraphidium neglectum]
MDLLYRLAHSKEKGADRLRSAIAACCHDGAFLRDCLEPLLTKLGCDALCTVSCRQQLEQLLGAIYTVPGLLQQLEAALQLPAGTGCLPADPSGVAWFALSVAQRVDGARSDPALLALIAPLEARGGAAKQAAKQLRVLTSGAAAGEGGGGGGGAEEAVLGVALKPRPCVMVSAALPPGHRALQHRTEQERLRFWREFGHGTLASDALVCLAMPPAAQGGPPRLVFATVVRRDPEDMAMGPDPMVGLAFEPGPDVESVLQHMGEGPLPGTVLVQASSNFLSSKPVLRCLQSLPGVPLAPELVHARPPAAVDYLPPASVEQALQQRSTLDPSQQQALTQALTQRVAIIQGPPGTGKTFVGVEACLAILGSSSQKIMCVTYTNHALDQFLEALLDRGVTDIVRVGGRSKSERMKQLQLKEIASAPASAGAGGKASNLGQAERRRLWQVQTELDGLQEEVKALTERLAALEDAPRPPAPGSGPLPQGGSGRGAGGRSGRQAAPAPPPTAAEQWRRRAELDVAGAEKAAATAHFRERLAALKAAEARWAHVADPAAGPVEMLEDIWALPPRLRAPLAAAWRRGARGEAAEELAGVLERVGRLQQERTELYDGSLEAVLRKARVIGCTTTGAAMHQALLTGPSVAPGVVMVEEAAEILEAHVITALSQRTKHVILIGDHKQLRPKVDNWELAVQSGNGYNLNVSLFERLVLAGFPHATLGVQHRMHPDISRLIKHTYPALQDHPSVAGHPPVLGLAPGRRVLFINHDVEEDGAARRGWSARQDLAQQSKSNGHEARLAVACVSYFVQQGYDASRIVILTPYLGQLMELHREMAAARLDAALNDRDLRDLRAAAGAEAAGIKGGGNGGGGGGAGSVRAATIDNCQGEESDLVVATLVRSNPKGSVGFLREPERINVLLSRARHLLLLIGNAQTLRGASNAAARHHWGVVLNKIEVAGGMVDGLPAVCQQHGHVTHPFLAAPEDFAARAPNGGCTQPCGDSLPCGHACPLRCHAYDRDHANAFCRELVYSYCDAGHLVSRRCSDPAGACGTCAEIRRVQEEERRRVEELEKDAARKRAQADVQKAKMEARVEELKKKQALLETQLASRKAAVELELQQKRLEKEVAVTEHANRRELAAWEKDRREEAARELERLEQDAKAQDAAKAIEAEAEAAARRAAAAQAAELARVQRELEQLDRSTDRQLQEIVNQKRRAEAVAGEKLGGLARRAQADAAVYITAAKFKQAAVGVAAAPDPKTALAALRALLQQHSAAAAAGGGGGAGDALDLALDAPGLGDVLLRYATSTDTAAGAISVGDGARRGAGTTVQAPLPARLLRGLDLLKEGKPLDALDVFSAMLKPKEEAAAAGQPGAGLQRSLGLLMERKPLDALNAFSGMLKPKQADRRLGATPRAAAARVRCTARGGGSGGPAAPGGGGPPAAELDAV